MSLAAYPISTVIPLDLSSESSCTCRHCTWVTFPRNSVIQYPATCTFLVETILSLHVEDFQPNFFVKRKYIGYSFWIWTILPLIQGQYGLVSLATYPISTVSVIDMSSESSCTRLCSMKAPDGVSCLFEKLYHVLVRLSVGHLFKQQFQSINERCPTVVSCHWWRKKGLIRVAWQIFVIGLNLVQVKPGSDLGLTWVCLPYFWFDHLAVASWRFSTNLFWREKINCIFNYDM